MHWCAEVKNSAGIPAEFYPTVGADAIPHVLPEFTQPICSYSCCCSIRHAFKLNELLKSAHLYKVQPINEKWVGWY